MLFEEFQDCHHGQQIAIRWPSWISEWNNFNNWLLRQKAITTPLHKSLDKQYRDTCICQWKLHSYLYLLMKKYIGNIVCLSNNINR